MSYEKSMLPDRVPGPPPTYIEALAGDLAPYISDIRPLAMNDISGGVPAYRIDDAVWTAINLFARNWNLSGPLDAGFDGYVWSDLPYPDNSLVPSTYVIYPGVDRYPAGIDRSWGWQKAPVAIYMFLVFKLQLSHVAKVGNEVRLCSTCDVACASDCNATCFDGCHSACKGCNGCSDACTNSCSGGCKGCSSCTGSCADHCTGCSSGCSGNCLGGCGAGCYGCVGGCAGSCSQACKGACTNGCNGGVSKAV